MPTKVLPTAADIRALQALVQENTDRVWHVTTGLEEYRKKHPGGKIVPPSPRVGGETGLFTTIGVFKIFLWLTFVESLDKARDKDAGRVVVEQEGVAVYFRDVHRTGRYVQNMAGEGEIMMTRLRAAPVCDREGCHRHGITKRLISSASKRGIGSHYFICPACFTTSRWLRNTTLLPLLSVNAYARLTDRTRKHDNWKDECKKNGKKPGAAIRRRKGWRQVP